MENATTIRSRLARYLLDNNRMVVEPTLEIMHLFPLGAVEKAAWLKAAAKLLEDAVELRKPLTPAGRPTLVVKDRGVLFTQAEAEAMAAMARKRKEQNHA